MPLDIRPFTTDTLYEALRSPKQSVDEVIAHEQARYLYRYLTDIGAQTMVVEPEYVDADYLDDFASYYVRSFDDLQRKCRRLHFFSNPWDAPDLQDVLLRPDSSAVLQTSYLGFVVARPLPQAIIGRTVLVTYPSDGERRHYPTTRDYVANLYGTRLTVKSLAFQEQDTVLAACATVALWSAFHKTSDLFNTTAPTPAQITRSANVGVFSSRPLPSKGLTPIQMARAVRDIGLEPELFQCNQKLPLLSLLVAYTAFGIPPIMGLDIEDHGLHAVAVTGYSLVKKRVHAKESTDLKPLTRVGLRVNEIYAHDDQHGPFARMVAREITPTKAEDSSIVFEGSWSTRVGGKPATLKPTWVLIPVYHKIRLTFLDVQKWITRFAAVTNKVLAVTDDVEWDVSLVDTSDLKRAAKATSLSADRIEELIFSSQPRFLWRARMLIGSLPAAELLFDATGMARSSPAFDVIFYDDEFRRRFAKVVALPAWSRQMDRTFLELLRNKSM